MSPNNKNGNKATAKRAYLPCNSALSDSQAGGNTANPQIQKSKKWISEGFIQADS